MKKTLIGVLAAIVLVVGLLIWQGENILNFIFYDMNATMDLPENLYDDESLTGSGGSSDLYIVDVNDYLSLRKEPKSGAEVLAKLKPDTKVQILDDAEDPYVEVYVPDEGITGYVHEDYIVKE